MTAGQNFLPELPNGWRSGRLLEVAETRTSNIDKHSVDGQQAVRLCNYVDVYYNETITRSIDYMRASATDVQIDRFRIFRGDTLITKDSESADDIGIPAFVDYQSGDLVCGYHLAIVRPRQNLIEPKYIFWVMRSAPTLRQWTVRATGVTRVGIKAGDLARAAIPIPPRNEQRAIADYLDRETQKIDELITEQRGLIETLRELRIATISRTVRSGLNTEVETQASGVDWLGSVPAHWEVKRLKYSVDSAVPGVWGSDPAGDETDVRCVRVADFDRSRLRVGNEIETIRSVDLKNRKSRELQRGDLLIEKSGGTAINPVGFVAMYEGGSELTVYANFIARMRPVVGQVPRYWLYAHAAIYATRLTFRSVKQTTGIQNLDQSAYFDELFPYPPPEEQCAIVDYLDEQTVRIDELISQSEDLITLSQERRAALITAAVTGQIDVGEAS